MTECPPSSCTTETVLALRLNGQALQVPAACTLAQLIDQFAYNTQSLATAVNGRFVPREQRGHTVLQPGDEVITFEAVVGG